jgi:hypothetical protein
LPRWFQRWVGFSANFADVPELSAQDAPCKTAARVVGSSTGRGWLGACVCSYVACVAFEQFGGGLFAVNLADALMLSAWVLSLRLADVRSGVTLIIPCYTA